MGNIDAGTVLNRLHQIYGVTNDNQLAERLSVKRSTLGNWRARNAVPYTICVSSALAFGYSLDWLLTGDGAPLKGENPTGPSLAPSEAAILDLYRALDEGAQRDIQSAAEGKKHLMDIERRLKDLSAQVAQLKKPA